MPRVDFLRVRHGIVRLARDGLHSFRHHHHEASHTGTRGVTAWRAGLESDGSGSSRLPHGRASSDTALSDTSLRESLSSETAQCVQQQAVQQQLQPWRSPETPGQVSKFVESLFEGPQEPWRSQGSTSQVSRFIRSHICHQQRMPSVTSYAALASPQQHWQKQQQQQQYWLQHLHVAQRAAFTTSASSVPSHSHSHSHSSTAGSPGPVLSSHSAAATHARTSSSCYSSSSVSQSSQTSQTSSTTSPTLQHGQASQTSPTSPTSLNSQPSSTPPNGSVVPAGNKQPDQFIPVKAVYVARSLDVRGLAGPSGFGGMQLLPAKNNVIIRFPNRSLPLPLHAALSKPGMEACVPAPERYMVAFHYGSVVFFNFDRTEEALALDIVTQHCTGAFKEAHSDEYSVIARAGLKGWSEGGHDYVAVRQLDVNNIRVISSILGQSVALDHYARKVDEMVNTFSELNRGMEQSGTFTMTRKKLFQLVAAANTTLADVILRIGLLERSDTAWRHAEYSKIWEFLRDDFELDERFESLDFKLNIIQHNVRFFLDILQNRKSDTLEWIIILLIAGEICVSLYEIIFRSMENSK